MTVTGGTQGVRQRFRTMIICSRLAVLCATNTEYIYYCFSTRARKAGDLSKSRSPANHMSVACV